MNADVVVVGSGASGLTAALAAAVREADVVVLEKGRLVGGTSSMSGGMLWVPNNRYMREAGISDSREDALAYIRRLTLGRVADELIVTFVDECNETVEFLERHTNIRFHAHLDHPDYQPELPGGRPGGRGIGGDLYDTSRLGAFQPLLRFGPNTLPVKHLARTADGELTSDRAAWDFPGLARSLNEGQVGSGRALVGELLEACLAHGVRLLNETRAVELVRRGSRVAGVVAQKNGTTERFDARLGVVLATGGFEWNRTLIDRFLGVPLELPSSSPTNVGDGLRMAMQVGATLGNMTEAWWAPALHVPGETYEDGPMNRHIVDPRSKPGSIIVNRQGRRFFNEATNYNDAPKAMMAFDPTTFSYPNLPCWLIFDAEYRRTYPIATLTPSDPTPTWITVGNTLEELAHAVGIDAEGLVQQVADFNRDAARGVDPVFHRGEGVYDRYRSDKNVQPNGNLRPLGGGPYHAVELRIGSMGTKGGPVIDTCGRVLDHNDLPIPGLYAAGNVVANVFGPSYPGPGATLASGATFGRLAAQHMLAARDDPAAD